MDRSKIVKDYALKNYPKLFKKKVTTRNKGRIVSVDYKDTDCIVVDGGCCWYVFNHVDASPLILSKNI